MVATVQLTERNGAGETITDKSSGEIRFKGADDANTDLNDPLVIPGSGQAYSYEKWIRLRITDVGGATQISNLQAYGSGTGSPEYATGIKVWYYTQGSFLTPVAPDTGDDPPVQQGSPTQAMSDFLDTHSGNRIDMDAFNAGPFTPGSPDEDIGDYLVLVCEAEAGASPGVPTLDPSFVMSWDEI